LNWTHQSLVYTDNVNLLIENMKAVGKNKDAQRDASKVVGLEVNRGPIKCVIIFRYQNVTKNPNMKTIDVPVFCQKIGL